MNHIELICCTGTTDFVHITRQDVADADKSVGGILLLEIFCGGEHPASLQQSPAKPRNVFQLLTLILYVRVGDQLPRSLQLGYNFIAWLFIAPCRNRTAICCFGSHDDDELASLMDLYISTLNLDVSVKGTQPRPVKHLDGRNITLHTNFLECLK